MKVKCEHCLKEVDCITVSDGTTYFPFTWIKILEDKYLCGQCHGLEKIQTFKLSGLKVT